MAARIIDGRAIAKQIRMQVAQEVNELRERHNMQVHLVVVRVGEDSASRIYVQNKRRHAEEVGILSTEIVLPDSVSAHDLHQLVAKLNNDTAIHGILVQLPLPRHLNESDFYAAIHPSKDVDGFHPENTGRLWLGLPGIIPCTAAGVLELLRSTGVDLAGKQAVVIGRSNIVGKPVAALLQRANATVTMCHSRTQNLPDLCRSADVLVAAIGRARTVQGDWIKPGAVVIDVGINRLAEGKLAGDVDFAAAQDVAAWITPVPGGVGPMTIAFLLRNTLQAARSRLSS